MALASVSLLNRSLYNRTAGPLLSFVSAVLYEKMAASSLFSDTVIILQLSALIIVYKYCVFMGNW